MTQYTPGACSREQHIINCIVFLAKDEIITNQQSTVTVLLEATGSLAFNIDLGNVNAVVFLDLKKAFDTVDPEANLSLCGIQESAYDWLSPI